MTYVKIGFLLSLLLISVSIVNAGELSIEVQVYNPTDNAFLSNNDLLTDTITGPCLLIRHDYKLIIKPSHSDRSTWYRHIILLLEKGKTFDAELLGKNISVHYSFNSSSEELGDGTCEGIDNRITVKSHANKKGCLYIQINRIYHMQGIFITIFI